MVIRLSYLQSELNDEELNNREFASSWIIQGLRGDLIVGNADRGYPALKDDILNRLAAYSIPADEAPAVERIAPIIETLSNENDPSQDVLFGLMEEMEKDGSVTQQAFALLDEWRREERSRYQQQSKGHEPAR